MEDAPVKKKKKKKVRSNVDVNISVPRFTLKLREQTIEIEQKDGTVRTYTAREMDGENRAAHSKIISDSWNKDSDGNPTTVKDYKPHRSDLIARCLFDEDNKPISEDVIRKWPASQIELIHGVCFNLNEDTKLPAGDEDDSGNE